MRRENGSWPHFLPPVSTLDQRQALFVVGAAFVLSRIVYFLLGVRFDTSVLSGAAQYVDVPLLKANLFQSIYYLHSQPPLFNLFLGIVLNLFPNNSTSVFQIVYLTLGLVLAFALLKTMIRLGVAPARSAVLATLFMISPAVILYENWLYYTYPLAVMICLGMYFLHRFLTRFQLRDGIAFFSLLGGVVLIRSLFHLVWFLLLTALLFLLRRRQRKQILIAAAAPLALVLLLYFKNLAVFGQFSSSSWLGADLSKLATMPVPLAERQSLVHQGKLSQLSLLDPWGTSSAAFRPYVPARAPTHIPALDQEAKDVGNPNYNNLVYIDIGRSYLHDALYLVRHRPQTYLGSVLRAWGTSFLPTSDYAALRGNAAHIRGLNNLSYLLVSGTLLTMPHYKTYTEGPELAETGFFTIAAFILSVVFGIGWALGKRPQGLGESALRLTVLVIVTVMLYVPLVGNAVDVGENNRFRFMIDPLLLVMIGVVLEHALRKFGRRLLRLVGLWAAICVGAFVLRQAWPNRKVESRELVYQATAEIRANNADRARAGLHEAIEIDPNSVLAHFWLAALLNSSGKLDSAIIEMRTAVRLAPDDEALYSHLALRLVQAGRLDSALAELREFERRCPYSAEARNYAAFVLSRLGQPDSAVAEFGRAVQLDTLAPELHCNLAGALLAAGDYRSAIASYGQTLHLDTTFAEAKAGLAAAYERAGLLDSAALWESRARKPVSAVRSPKYRYDIWPGANEAQPKNSP
jgi:Tfp pilus assembly protein PilF